MRLVFLWLCGLIVFALMTGATGITLSNSGVDRAFHDTYYVVAHFHYALTIIIIFAVFAVIYFALHTWANRTVPFWAGVIQFALMFVGILLTVFPQYFLGRHGMPRRYIDYPEAFAWWNTLSAFGAVLSSLSLIVFIGILIYMVFWARPKTPRGNASEE